MSLLQRKLVMPAYPRLSVTNLIISVTNLTISVTNLIISFTNLTINVTNLIINGTTLTCQEDLVVIVACPIFAHGVTNLTINVTNLNTHATPPQNQRPTSLRLSVTNYS